MIQCIKIDAKSNEIVGNFTLLVLYRIKYGTFDEIRVHVEVSEVFLFGVVRFVYVIKCDEHKN